MATVQEWMDAPMTTRHVARTLAEDKVGNEFVVSTIQRRDYEGGDYETIVFPVDMWDEVQTSIFEVRHRTKELATINHALIADVMVKYIPQKKWWDYYTHNEEGEENYAI